MRTPEERDQQTVVIATALGLFVVIVVIATLALWLLDVDEERAGSIYAVVAIVAGGLAVINLLRTSKR